jgi:hypothetical protein
MLISVFAERRMYVDYDTFKEINKYGAFGIVIYQKENETELNNFVEKIVGVKSRNDWRPGEIQGILSKIDLAAETSPDGKYYQNLSSIYNNVAVGDKIKVENAAKLIPKISDDNEKMAICFAIIKKYAPTMNAGIDWSSEFPSIPKWMEKL